jgi:hypothetical protein
VRFSQQRLADEPNRDARGGSGDGSSESGAAGPDYEDIMLEGLVLSHRNP